MEAILIQKASFYSITTQSIRDESRAEPQSSPSLCHQRQGIKFLLIIPQQWFGGRTNSRRWWPWWTRSLVLTQPLLFWKDLTFLKPCVLHHSQLPIEKLELWHSANVSHWLIMPLLTQNSHRQCICLTKVSYHSQKEQQISRMKDHPDMYSGGVPSRTSSLSQAHMLREQHRFFGTGFYPRSIGSLLADTEALWMWSSPQGKLADTQRLAFPQDPSSSTDTSGHEEIQGILVGRASDSHAPLGQALPGSPCLLVKRELIGATSTQANVHMNTSRIPKFRFTFQREYFAWLFNSFSFNQNIQNYC